MLLKCEISSSYVYVSENLSPAVNQQCNECTAGWCLKRWWQRQKWPVNCEMIKEAVLIARTGEEIQSALLVLTFKNPEQ